MAKKINISFPPAVVAEMDEYCKMTGLTRSGLCSLSVQSYIYAHKATGLMGRMVEALEAIAEKGNATAEEMQKLEEFEKSIALLTGRTE